MGIELARHTKISIHAPHARSDDAALVGIALDDHISIHAPHARSDALQRILVLARVQISIHAPHARSDFPFGLLVLYTDNFNPRSSCEERPGRPAS